MKVILFILFVMFILGQLGRIQIFDGVALNLLDIASFLVFLALIRRVQYLKRPLLLIPLLSFFLICILSLVLNTTWLLGEQFLISSLYLVRFIMYSSIYFYVVTFSKKEIEFVTSVLFYAGACLVFLGYLQFFLYPNLRNLYYMGWDDHLYRLFGTFLDPNYTGVFYVLYSIFLAGLLTLKKYPFNKFVMGGLLVLTLIAILLTYSRTTFIMLLVGYVAFQIIQKKFVYLGIGVICFVALLFFFSNPNIENRNPFRVASSIARLESIRDGLIVFSNKPLFGVGFNSYRYAQHKYKTRTGPDWVRSHADAGVENSFVFVLATTGIVGFITYIILLKTMIISSYKRLNTSYGKIAFVSLVALIVSAQFINSLFYPSLLVWMWVILGIMEST